ncbi:MAG: glycosyltransferase family 9 protein [Gammaproteobacteria bacterium]
MKFWFTKGAWASKKARRVIKTISRDQIKKIAVIRHAALGDMVLTRAFLVEARKAFPNAEITLSIVSNYTRGCPDDLVDRLHVVHGKGDPASLLHRIKRIKELGAQDIIFDLAITNRSMKTCVLNKATLKIGFPYRALQARLVYDVATCRSDLNFEVNDMLNQLHIFGVTTSYPHDYSMPGTALKRSRPYIVYFTGASATYKCWPSHCFSELIKRMHTAYPDHDHLVLEGILDWEKKKARAIIEPFNGSVNTGSIQADTIEDTTRLLKGADLVVSNDTGIRHVAIVSGTPTVGIFFVDPYRYWPRYGVHEIALPDEDGPPEVDEVYAMCNKIMVYTKKPPAERTHEHMPVSPRKIPPQSKQEQLSIRSPVTCSNTHQSAIAAQNFKAPAISKVRQYTTIAKAKILKRLARKSYVEDFRPETFHNILIVRPAKIGDTICMFPLIRELKKALPKANIDIYASTYNNFMFKYVPQVRNVYTKYKDRDAPKTFLDILRMHSNHYDLIIDTIDIRFGKVIALLLIHGKWLIANTGYESKYGLDNSDLSLYYKVNSWKQVHTTERLLEFLQILGIEDYDNSLEFPIGDQSYQFARSFLQPYSGYKLIGLNADASDDSRSVLDDETVEICRRLNNLDADIRILLFSTPDRHQHFRTLIANSELHNVILEEGSKSIFDAAALTSLMSVMISTNTSFVHIASAFDIPTVGIFQNDKNHLTYWAPRSSRHIIIHPEQPGDSVRGFSIQETVSAAISLLENNT